MKYTELKQLLYSNLMLGIFLTHVFSGIAFELGHQLTHLDDYFNSEQIFHTTDHSNQSHSHDWIVNQDHPGPGDKIDTQELSQKIFMMCSKLEKPSNAAELREKISLEKKPLYIAPSSDVPSLPPLLNC